MANSTSRKKAIITRRRRQPKTETTRTAVGSIDGSRRQASPMSGRPASMRGSRGENTGPRHGSGSASVHSSGDGASTLGGVRRGGAAWREGGGEGEVGRGRGDGGIVAPGTPTRAPHAGQLAA